MTRACSGLQVRVARTSETITALTEIAVARVASVARRCGRRVFVYAVSGIRGKIASDRGGSCAACCLCAGIGIVPSWKICAAAIAHHNL